MFCVEAIYFAHKVGVQNKRIFKLAPVLKTLVGPYLEQADHCSTPLSPTAYNLLLQCLAKGQSPPQRAQAPLQGKAGPKI